MRHIIILINMPSKFSEFFFPRNFLLRAIHLDYSHVCRPEPLLASLHTNDSRYYSQLHERAPHSPHRKAKLRSNATGCEASSLLSSISRGRAYNRQKYSLATRWKALVYISNIISISIYKYYCANTQAISRSMQAQHEIRALPSLRLFEVATNSSGAQQYYYIRVSIGGFRFNPATV